MRRLLAPVGTDIASLVAFLTSDDTGFIYPVRGMMDLGMMLHISG